MGRISVRLEVFGEEWDPDRIARMSGVEPTELLRPHQTPRLLTFSKQQVHPESAGVWVLDTAAHVNSKDVEEHFRYVLKMVLPCLPDFDAASIGAGRSTRLDWESTQADSAGPQLSAEILSGLAQLKVP